MKRKQIYTICCSFMLVLISASLTVSTLHSHNHIEWHHPQKHVDTGHCLMADSTVCPMCAYLFNAKLNPAIDAEYLFNGFEEINEQADHFTVDLHITSVPGRSPPFSV